MFKDFCDEQQIKHFQIVTGVSRGNGQVERYEQNCKIWIDKVIHK